MKLYGSAYSQNARKIRALIRHLDLEVESHEVQLAVGEHRTPAYLAINPMGKVPSLVDGELKLWESNAILLYLAAKAGSSLVPSDLAARADVERWLFWESCHWLHAISKVAFNRIFRPMMGQSPNEAEVSQGLKEFARFGAVLDAQLAERDFVAGDLSVADFSIGASAELLAPAAIPLDGLDHVRSWLGRLREVKGWQEPAPGA